MQCDHMKFDAEVKIIRIEDKGRFMSEIEVRCRDCKRPFQFLGLDAGLNMNGARVSLDGLRAAIAICPQGDRPNPMQMMLLRSEVKH